MTENRPSLNRDLADSSDTDDRTDRSSTAEQPAKLGLATLLKSGVAWFLTLTRFQRVIVSGVAVLMVIAVIVVIAISGQTRSGNGDPSEFGDINTPTTVHKVPGDTSANSRKKDTSNEPSEKAGEERHTTSRRGEDNPQELVDVPVAIYENGNPTAKDRGISAANSAENDAKVANLSLTLDRIVSKTEPTIAGFEKISASLRNKGVVDDGSIRNSYQMLEYAAGKYGDFAFVSRASTPEIFATQVPGIYEVEYLVAGQLIPTVKANPQSEAALARIFDSFRDALVAGIGVPVTFTVNLNTNEVSINPSQWW